MLRKRTHIARVAAYAEMCDFPCTRQELLQVADEQQFPDDVLDVFEDMPDREYTCESDVVEAAGDLAEAESTQPEANVEVER